MSPAELTARLRCERYRLGTEAVLQDSLGEALDRIGVGFEREVRLAPGDRIDFLVAGGIGIEVKLRCSARIIYRQLVRYAERDQVESLILLSATAIGLPPAIGGKPLFYISAGRAAL